MTDELHRDLCNRLQVCSLALESIDEHTDKASVMQRLQNVLKQIELMGKRIHESRESLGGVAEIPKER